jgi:hypothetical protein
LPDIPVNPDCSLAGAAPKNQWIVGRVSTRHVGLKADLQQMMTRGNKFQEERSTTLDGLAAQPVSGAGFAVCGGCIGDDELLTPALMGASWYWH